MKDTLRSLLSAVLWTTSASMMVVGATRDSTHLMEWGIWVAMVASMVTGWIVADCAVHRERIRVDRLVQAVVDRLGRGKDAGIHRL